MSPGALRTANSWDICSTSPVSASSSKHSWGINKLSLREFWRRNGIQIFLWSNRRTRTRLRRNWVMPVAVATADNSYLLRVSHTAKKCTEHHGNFREQQSKRQSGAVSMRSCGMRIRVTCPKVQAKIVIMSQSPWYTKGWCAHIFTSHCTTYSGILIFGYSRERSEQRTMFGHVRGINWLPVHLNLFSLSLNGNPNFYISSFICFKQMCRRSNGILSLPLCARLDCMLSLLLSTSQTGTHAV